MSELDLLQQHYRVVRASITVVSQVGPNDLGLPTPCRDWTLADLLAHMTVQHLGFAAASAGKGGDLAGVLEREFALPEFSPTSTFPGGLAVGFHLIERIASSRPDRRAPRPVAILAPLTLGTSSGQSRSKAARMAADRADSWAGRK